MEPVRRLNINSLYGEAFDFPVYPEGPSLSYMIATVPRSGSTFFSMQLWRSGWLGAPLEYLNLRNMDQIVQRLGQGDYLAYWSQVKMRRTSSNGVFGVKVFVENLRHIALRHPELLPHTGVDKVVFFKRDDLAGHAVSYARALQTQAWFWGSEEVQQPEYSFSEIAEAERAIKAQYERWEEIFAEIGVDPLRISYEDVLANPEAIIDEVTSFLDVTPVVALRHIPLVRKQRDDVNREWKARYRREKNSVRS